jgi:hypothetical protein
MNDNQAHEQAGYEAGRSGNVDSGRYADQTSIGKSYRDGIRRWNREESDAREVQRAKDDAAAQAALISAPPILVVDAGPSPGLSEMISRERRIEDAAREVLKKEGLPVAEPAPLGFALFGTDLFGNPIVPEKRGPLAERFIIPPFSVLDARGGDWQERKRAWLGVGIESEVGRGENLLKMSDTMLEPDPEKRAAAKGKAKTFNTESPVRATNGEESTTLPGGGTSIFDPVLCELAYRWWCGAGGQIIDCFSGGSVRGIIAELCGRRYWGCDLRQEQVEANRAQALKICPADLQPVWVCGDSAVKMAEAPEADFLFSCPPYGDLEVYSDDPSDLSAMEHAEFVKAYHEIIRISCTRLKADRFAAFVIGDFRDKKGNYRNFVSETISAFLAAGLSLYNEAILVTPVGMAAMRANGTFSAGRKLVKSHQNVLVFCKGDWKRAAMATGEV